MRGVVGFVLWLGACFGFEAANGNGNESAHGERAGEVVAVAVAYEDVVDDVADDVDEADAGARP